MADKMSIDKKDLVDGETPESPVSSLGPDTHAGHGASGAVNGATSIPQDGQQPKRKGGRKPIYATSEERKQRNRQAQAAFRERRTEYIKQLEEAIRVHEGNLQSLQAAHRTAADECLMLRYKNSLLERILLEKGIDVQAELRAKTGSPNLGPTHMPQNLVQPPSIGRSIMGRSTGRRTNSSIAPKLEPGMTSLPPPIQQQQQQQPGYPSPKNRPTPPSHANSPNGNPAFAGPAAVSPAASDGPPRSGLSGLKNQMSPLAPMNPATRAHMMSGGPARVGTGAQYYPTPGFQNHIEQLEQEYDAPSDLVDDSEMDTPGGGHAYPPPFADGHQSMVPSPNSAVNGHHVTQGEAVQSSQAPHGGYPSMTQLLDHSGGDWDPFGLSASMAFPTQFSFDTSNMR